MTNPNDISTTKYLAVALCVGVLVVGATALFNFKANTWGIYADDYQTFHLRIRPNRHWMKTDYLLNAPHSYDCILFGSSRVAAIDVRKLEGNCYNFTHSGGLPSNHLTALRGFLERGLPIKRIYLGLDDISYQWNPNFGDVQHMRRGYPTSLADWLDAQVFYLLQPIKLKNMGLVSGAVRRQKLPFHIVDPNLDWERINTESLAFLEDPAAQDAKFRELRSTLAGGAYHGSSAAKSVRKFVRLARGHGVEVVMFFNPLHYKTYFTRNYTNYLDFKRQLADVGPFYDFTGLNRYSIDNGFWKETSHYSSLVGDHMARILSGEPAGQSGFGRLVSADNLSRLEREQVAIDLQRVPGVVQAEGLIELPARYVRALQEEDRLRAATVVQPKGQANRVFVDGGDIILHRGQPAKDYRPGVWTRLKPDRMFLLEFSVEMERWDRLMFRLRQDESQFESGWRSYLYLQSGDTGAGYIAGFTSVNRPPIRIGLGEGDVHQRWQPLKLYQILPGRQSATPRQG